MTATISRGELWAYAPQGSPRQMLVAIVSSDGVNASPRTWLLAAPVTGDDPEDILAVPVDDHGWVNAGVMTRVYRPWLVERIGALDAETTDTLDTALRAALDL